MGRQPGGSMARGGWGAALLAAGLLMGLAARADIVVPLVTPNTTITLTNPTAKAATGSATFTGTGSIGTGTETVPYSIPAFSETNVANPVTVDPTLGYYPDAQIVPDIDPSTGAKYADPITHAFVCDNNNGHDSPTWNTADRQNTQPLAGTENYQEDILVVASGDQPCTFTVTAYGPNGEGPIYSQPIHFGANHALTGKLNLIMNHGLAPHYGVQVHFDGPTGANGRAALMHTDAATLDTRIEEMKKYTPADEPLSMIAKAYVNKWITCTGCSAYFSNREIRAAISGTANTRSYAPDLAQLIYPNNTDVFMSVSDAEAWLRNQVDGNDANGELWRANDPFGWNARSVPVIAFWLEPDASLKIFKMDATTMQQLYDLFKDDFLWKHVMYNPQLYGGSVGGTPDMNLNPTWNAQDPN